MSPQNYRITRTHQPPPVDEPTGQPGVRAGHEDSVTPDARDTLEDLLLNAKIDGKTSDETAEGILDAGWRPPAQVIDAEQAIVSRPDAKAPTPALIEAAYIAQDDLSKPPEQWAIRAAAEVIGAYIDAQDHTEVHVLGHPTETGDTQ